MAAGVGDTFQQDTKYHRDQREKGLFEQVRPGTVQGVSWQQ